MEIYWDEKWDFSQLLILRYGSKELNLSLKIGCGFGRHIKILAPFSKEVVGIDKETVMIEKAKNNLSNFKNVRLFVMNAEELGLRSSYFDYVICMTNTFGNFGNSKLRILEEMRRVCKDNGKIILSV